MSSRVARTMVELVLDPVKGWAHVDVRSDWRWPLLALTLATALAWVTYYAQVDMEWLQDHLFASDSALEGRQLQFARNLFGRGLLTTLSIVSSLLVSGTIMLLTAAYLTVVGRTNRRPQPYLSWVGCAAWLTVPDTVTLLLMALRCGVGDISNLAPEISNPLSIAQMAGMGIGSRWLSLAGALGVQSLWTVALCAAGLRHWLGVGWGRAASIAMAPAVLVYGAWAVGIATGALE